MPFKASPIGGMMMSLTRDVTIRPKARPMTMPTAMSNKLPRITKSRNSRSMLGPPRRHDVKSSEYSGGRLTNSCGVRVWGGGSRSSGGICPRPERVAAPILRHHRRPCRGGPPLRLVAVARGAATHHHGLRRRQVLPCVLRRSEDAPLVAAGRARDDADGVQIPSLRHRSGLPASVLCHCSHPLSPVSATTRAGTTWRLPCRAKSRRFVTRAATGAPEPLHCVQSNVGGAAERFGALPVGRTRRGAPRDAERALPDAAAEPKRRRREIPEHRWRAVIGVAQEHGELVAAEARQHIG